MIQQSLHVFGLGGIFFDNVKSVNAPEDSLRVQLDREGCSVFRYVNGDPEKCSAVDCKIDLGVEISLKQQVKCAVRV